jgi:hypothetical protein
MKLISSNNYGRAQEIADMKNLNAGEWKHVPIDARRRNEILKDLRKAYEFLASDLIGGFTLHEQRYLIGKMP